MTTTEANPNTSRLAAMRASPTGTEWARVAAGVDLRRGAGRGGFSAVVESYLIEASAHTMASSPTASWFEYRPGRGPF